MDVKSVSILGVTGSVGRTTAQILLEHKERFEVICVTANQNYKLLAEYAIKLNAKYAVIADSKYYNDLKNLLQGTKIKVLTGNEGLIEAAQLPADILVAAISGFIALKPVMAAIETGKIIALANKECLVCAGRIMIEAAKRNKAVILPVDSEHNALFQILACNKEHDKFIKYITLTASGGAFINYNVEQLKHVTIKEALNHPSWKMGDKITIDSATLMNKALEVIEAYYLFDLDVSQIKAVIHPQSIVHALVEYQDGSVIAQMGYPDMRMPISYCLAGTERLKLKNKDFDLCEIAKLEFSSIDDAKYPAFKLAYEVLKQEGAAPIILNVANEIAVRKFLQGEIEFNEIYNFISRCLNAHNFFTPAKINDVHYIIDAVCNFSSN